MEESKDLHEEALRHLALEELNVTANLAFLNAKARDRGWSGRGEINSNSANLPAGDTHYHLHLHAQSGSRLASLSNDELIAHIAQRQAQLAAPIEIIPPQPSELDDPEPEPPLIDSPHD